MDDKLKPCPFCGGKPHLAREMCPDEGGRFAFVKCGSCRAKSPEKYHSAGNDCPQFYAEIRDTWNTRATLPDMSQDDGDPECLTIAYMQGVADGRDDRWQPIETAPPEDHETFLVFDGIGAWKAWRLHGEIVGYEVDGAELPSDDYPPTHWMPLPAPPQEADT